MPCGNGWNDHARTDTAVSDPGRSRHDIAKIDDLSNQTLIEYGERLAQEVERLLAVKRDASRNLARERQRAGWAIGKFVVDAGLAIVGLLAAEISRGWSLLFTSMGLVRLAFDFAAVANDVLGLMDAWRRVRLLRLEAETVAREVEAVAEELERRGG